MIDAHCHLDDFEDYSEVIQRAKDAEVTGMLTCGTGVESSRRLVEMADAFAEVYTAAGLGYEPGISNLQFSIFKEFVNDSISKSKKIVAVGECGLDSEHVDIQLFEAHVELAQKTNLPIVVHCRNMFEDVFQVLSAKGEALRGIQMHCWTGNLEWANKFLSIGCYLSFGGIVTFKKSDELKDVLKHIPQERLLIETDAPYLTPEPKRGSRNEPANLKLVAAMVAELRNQSVEEVMRYTTENTRRLFRV